LTGKALLVSYPEGFIISEAVALCEASGYSVESVVTQNYLSRAKYGVGSGKAEEIKSIVEKKGIGKIIFDETLRTVQIYNLAKLTHAEVVDRERLILEIFNKRASSVEAKLQVQLAQLRYELPRAREKVRLAKSSEQPGFFGLGKYEVDTYFRAIRRQVGTINKKLQSVSKRRRLFHVQREKLGLPMISLSGYTGAGKTTIFNSLTGESKDVAPGVFTTLSTSTRAMAVDSSKVLLSDTVGFISRLPAYMIDAFKSTLEELVYSDLVLLVVDLTEESNIVQKKLDTCLNTLSDLGVQEGRILIAFNKVDKVSVGKEISNVKARINTYDLPSRYVSGKTGEGLSLIREAISHRVAKPMVETIVVGKKDIPELGVELNWLKQNANVRVTWKSETLEIEVEGPAWVIDHFKRLAVTKNRLIS
jgi:GTP-binding protein HflX